MTTIADLYANGPGHIIDEALEDLNRSFQAGAPTLAERTQAWMFARAGGGPLATYFTHPLAFPIVLLPWSLEGTLHAAHDRQFQAALARSSIAGYFAIRMIDDLMDGDRAIPPEVLPAALILHSEFLMVYRRAFPSDHQFWETFTVAWQGSAEAASKDAVLREIDRARFEVVAARKIAAVKIPLAAVAHRSGRAEVMPAWSRFVDLFGGWHQMLNDVLGWSEDLGHRRGTYFLSEATRRGVRSGAIAEWVVRDGIGWASGELEMMMEKVLIQARQLACPPLVLYLEARQRHADEWFDRLAPSLTALAHLASTLDPLTTSGSSVRRPDRDR